MWELWGPRPRANPSSASPTPCDLELRRSAPRWPMWREGRGQYASEWVDELNGLESGKCSGKCLARLVVWEYY